MNVTVSKSDVIWSYLGTGISLMSNLITIPMVVFFLDQDMLGLWYVFASIGSIANLFDFGFSITFARNVTYCWSGAKSLQKNGASRAESSEPDFKLLKDIISTCKLIYLVLSLLVLVFLVTFGTGYIHYISRNIIGNQHIIAWFIYAIGTFLNLYYNYYDSFLRGVGAIDKANKNRIIARSVHLLLMLILLLCGTGIIGASLAYIAYGFTFRFLGKYKFYQYHGIGEKIKSIKTETSKKEIRDIFKTVWYNAWRDGLIQLSSFCCDSLSVLICSLYLSLSETGIYSIAVQIATAVATLSSVLYATYQPSIQTAYVKNDMFKLKQSMSVILVVFLISFSFGVLLSCTIGVPLLSWIKPTAVISIPVLLGTCLNQFILKYRNCYTSYFSSTNRIIYMNAFVFSAFLCVALSFLFMGYFKWGVWGLIAAQILSQSIFNLWYWPITAHKELKTNSGEMLNLAYVYFKEKLNAKHK